MRIGNGYDIHRLVPDRPLILGGVPIPYEMGLEGHSDGDAVSHAIADSILGAIALGDIGLWFPADDEYFRGVNSIELLKKVVKSAKERGYSIGNVDCVIICERPKLSPHYSAMRTSLAAALEVSVECVSLKARTNERLGAVGRGEAIAVESVVLVY